MKIDYIVPTYNSASLLDKCLMAIKKYGDPNNIIIIDNFSKDKTIEIAKKNMIAKSSKPKPRSGNVD